MIPEDEDTPGLAGERTDLAWSRSALAVLAAVGAIVKRLIDTTTGPRGESVVVVLLVGGLVAWALAVAHARTVAATTITGRALADPGRLRWVARGTAALAAVALVLALLPD
ncbi:MAG: hypothetical protein KatS3mg009_2692 [Acidimicrobiia bacterium]|nr:MAG: hypothetical protein KatS3mg009_2692 [Acidimicrobiia bacterium]